MQRSGIEELASASGSGQFWHDATASISPDPLGSDTRFKPLKDQYSFCLEAISHMGEMLNNGKSQ